MIVSKRSGEMSPLRGGRARGDALARTWDHRRRAPALRSVLARERPDIADDHVAFRLLCHERSPDAQVRASACADQARLAPGKAPRIVPTSWPGALSRVDVAATSYPPAALTCMSMGLG